MNTFKKSLLGLLLLFINGMLSAQSLNECLLIAAENNSGLRAKYAEFEIALYEVSRSASLPDPTISFGYFISPVETRVGPQLFKVSLSQMFPWFGTLSAKGEMTTLIAEAKYQHFIEARNLLYYQVKKAWYELYELKRDIQLQEEYRDILISMRTLSLKSFENDKGSMVDVLRVDILLQEKNNTIELLKDKWKPLTSQFNYTLNIPDSVEISFPDTLIVSTHSIAYSKDSILLNHPILKAHDLSMRSAYAQENLAKKMAFPKLGVGLDYVVVGQANANVEDNGKDVFMPMATISLPIYRKKYQSAIKQAELTQTKIAASKQEYENNLLSNYDLSWYELQSAIKLIELYKQQIYTTESALSLLISDYANSGKEFEEILRMQEKLLQFRLSNTNAIKNFNIALAKVNYLTAKPLNYEETK